MPRSPPCARPSSCPRDVELLSSASMEYVLAIMHWTPDREATLTDAQRRARTALSLRPGHAQAWTALAGVAYARGHLDQCRADALRAIELSPAHPSILYASGLLLALSGEWDRGLGFIRESNRLNPYHPGYQHVYLALDRLMHDDPSGMLAEASLLTHPEDVWGPLVRFLAFAGLGDDDRAQEELDDALDLEPTLLTDDAAFLLEEIPDVPLEIRSTMRARVLTWLAARSEREQARADG